MVRTSVAILVLLTAMACGGTAAAPATTPHATFTMGAANGSGISGTGVVTKGTGSFVVSIQVHGMKPNSSHVSHVHVGTCAKPGGVAYALLEVVADAAGDPGLVDRTWVLITESPDGGWGINGHANTGEDIVLAARAALGSAR